MKGACTDQGLVEFGFHAFVLSSFLSFFSTHEPPSKLICFCSEALKLNVVFSQHVILVLVYPLLSELPTDIFFFLLLQTLMLCVVANMFIYESVFCCYFLYEKIGCYSRLTQPSLSCKFATCISRACRAQLEHVSYLQSVHKCAVSPIQVYYYSNCNFRKIWINYVKFIWLNRYIESFSKSPMFCDIDCSLMFIMFIANIIYKLILI